jgi:phosphoribosylaminoimidazolecarboxamide formyltransferase/IMP cyclohydrolase
MTQQPTEQQPERAPVRRALVSAYDKTGLEELGRALAEAGVEVVSTGSTAARLRDAGVAVTPVDAVTGFPECLDGRVKTLHPAVHAGILADRRLPDHVRQLAELDIAPFDLSCQTLPVRLRRGRERRRSRDECVEQIDIGRGPTMVRAAAKNVPSVAVVVDPALREVLEAVRPAAPPGEQRGGWPALAFRTRGYDVAVASWFAPVTTQRRRSRPGWAAPGSGSGCSRYGENPLQGSGALRERRAAWRPRAAARQADVVQQLRRRRRRLAGRARPRRRSRPWPSSSTPTRAGSAWETTSRRPTAARTPATPVSAFGGVIATNVPVSLAMAEQVADVFTEVVLAPGYDDGAVELLSRKPSIRLLVVSDDAPSPVELRPVSGGVLLQERDRLHADGDDPASWVLQSGEPLDDAGLRDLAFAWRCVRAVKSNAILLAQEGATVGVGMGQVNRVDAARLAVARAGERAAGSVAASDAFFPFPDGLQVLLDAGVRAVVQPGGSVRDDEVFAAAREAGVTLYTTGTRHFAH